VASTSAAEWVGITTNSEDCSVSSEMDVEEEARDGDEPRDQSEQPFAWEFEVVSRFASAFAWETKQASRRFLLINPEQSQVFGVKFSLR